MNSPGTRAAGAMATDAAWKAIEGAWDLQVHVAPAVIERRTDDIELAREFLAHGLRGFVLKSHYIPAAERAKVVTKAVPGIAAYGPVRLNHSVGGPNPVAVEIAGRSGAKIAWMPTVGAANETAGRPGTVHTLHRPGANHQPAGRRGVRDVCAAPPGRGIRRSRNPAQGGGKPRGAGGIKNQARSVPWSTGRKRCW